MNGQLPSSEWQSYHLYVGRHYALMDNLLVQFVKRLIDDIAPQSWFFIRYADQMGPHIRLRIRVDADQRVAVDRRVLTEMTTALDELSTFPPSRYLPLVSYDGPVNVSETDSGMIGPVEVRTVAYDPEWDVYGAAGEGMPIAEELFQTSSEIALTILSAESSGEVNLRKTLAPRLSETVLKIFVPEQGRQAFLRFYSSYWLSGTGLERALSERMAEKIEQLRRDRVPIIPAGERLGTFGALVQKWEDALRRAEIRYAAETRVYERAQKQKLLFNFLHLMNNRLGITPIDESYLTTLMAACEGGTEFL